MEKVMDIAKEFFDVCIYTEENDENLSSEEWNKISERLDELENRYYEESLKYSLEKQGVESREIENLISRGYKKREYMEELIEIYEDNYSPTR